MPNPPASPLPPGLPGTAGPLAGLTILAVEDSRLASEALRLLCRHSGARLRRADSLATARRHLALYRPDAVIVDLGLPDGPGDGLVAELAQARVRPAAGGPALIAISGDGALGPAALAAGADAFVEKPLPGLAAFQALVLRALPGGAGGDPAGAGMPRAAPPPSGPVAPDPMALRDDLMLAAGLLDQAMDPPTRAYLARFLGGVARSAGDLPLAEAARALREDAAAFGPGLPPAGPAAGAPPALRRVAALVRRRLDEGRGDPLHLHRPAPALHPPPGVEAG